MTQITDALAGLGEAEVAAVLSGLGAFGARKSGEPQSMAPRTPLPTPPACPRVRSEVEWV